MEKTKKNSIFLFLIFIVIIFAIAITVLACFNKNQNNVYIQTVIGVDEKKWKQHKYLGTNTTC